ncbi:hypothetical protein [Thomasclavelia spiroformis]|uniref:hypothetical protein n=1 Tax=Thomasclavelia spiroformis TaxID=29348 RepID=UPI000B37730B|nr:hypothetical protein [Thomasclavelia spiroformis]OUQ02757.1 hypothetical protein B5E98_04340 [Thomasclavelia spiroformis]
MERLIKIYLKNENFLYSTWYNKSNIKCLKDTEQSKFKNDLILPNKIREEFNKWLKKNYIELQRIVCCEFKYYEKKKTIEDTIELITLLAICLKRDFETTYIELATLLFLYGLDRLCPKKTNGK